MKKQGKLQFASSLADLHSAAQECRYRERNNVPNRTYENPNAFQTAKKSLRQNHSYTQIPYSDDRLE